MFKNPFSFKGRIRRLEYGFSLLIYFAIAMLFSLTGQNTPIEVLYLILILWVPLVWFIFSQGTKRCHDMNKSGWYQLIPFYVLWMIFAPGDEGDNRFGLDPKGNHNFGSSDIIDDDILRRHND